jgi:hypothetical protein
LTIWEVLKCGGGKGLRDQRNEHMINVEVSRIVKEERRILHTIKKKECQLDWSHLAEELPSKHITEGKIEEMMEVKFGYQRSRKLRTC